MARKVIHVQDSLLLAKAIYFYMAIAKIKLLQFGIIKITSFHITNDCSINLFISALNGITQFGNYTTSTAQ